MCYKFPISRLILTLNGFLKLYSNKLNQIFRISNSYFWKYINIKAYPKELHTKQASYIKDFIATVNKLFNKWNWNWEIIQ